jgi:plastocyanin
MVGSLAVLAIVLAACANGGEASQVAAESPGTSTPAPLAGVVSIVDFGFEPVDLTVATGATVTWTNTGEATHTVKWSDGTPESAGLTSSASYERTFETTGSYSYVCGIHGSMTGTITVTE